MFRNIRRDTWSNAVKGLSWLFQLLSSALKCNSKRSELKELPLTSEYSMLVHTVDGILRTFKKLI